MDFEKMIRMAQEWGRMNQELTQLIKDSQEQQEKLERDIHLKGYIYDSLVFRYMKARDAEMELDVIREGIEYSRAISRANRDKLRFMAILNEVIGEHD